jgi:hypothetical protein
MRLAINWRRLVGPRTRQSINFPRSFRLFGENNQRLPKQRKYVRVSVPHVIKLIWSCLYFPVHPLGCCRLSLLRYAGEKIIE